MDHLEGWMSHQGTCSGGFWCKSERSLRVAVSVAGGAAAAGRGGSYWGASCGGCPHPAHALSGAGAVDRVKPADRAGCPAFCRPHSQHLAVFLARGVAPKLLVARRRGIDLQSQHNAYAPNACVLITSIAHPFAIVICRPGMGKSDRVVACRRGVGSGSRNVAPHKIQSDCWVLVCCTSMVRSFRGAARSSCQTKNRSKGCLSAACG